MKRLAVISPEAELAGFLSDSNDVIDIVVGRLAGSKLPTEWYCKRYSPYQLVRASTAEELSQLQRLVTTRRSALSVCMALFSSVLSIEARFGLSRELELRLSRGPDGVELECYLLDVMLAAALPNSADSAGAISVCEELPVVGKLVNVIADSQVRIKASIECWRPISERLAAEGVNSELVYAAMLQAGTVRCVSLGKYDEAIELAEPNPRQIDAYSETIATAVSRSVTEWVGTVKSWATARDTPRPLRLNAVLAESAMRRDGFNEAFLGRSGRLRVLMPELGSGMRDDVVSISAGLRARDPYTLQYTHFSVVMCASRRLPYFAAVNVRSEAYSFIRKKRETWFEEVRIPGDSQISQDLCRRAKVDLIGLVGHSSPAWGSPAEASQAEKDTYCLTNAVPHMEIWQQSVWLQLEEYLLASTGLSDAKLSVFCGPVFCECDPSFGGMAAPDQFWKIAVMVRSDGNLSATGFLISDRHFDDDVEFIFSMPRTYQISIRRIEHITGLSFGVLSDHDPMRPGLLTPNQLGSVRRLSHVGEIVQ